MPGERRVLDSWKEIAVYLGRTEKTCRDWERHFGLPVHRLTDSAKARVFAFSDEIDAWRDRRALFPHIKDEESPPRSGPSPRPTARRIVWGFLLAVSTAGVILLTWMYLGRPSVDGRVAGSDRPSRSSIAVLPFVDLSPNKQYEYLCDGMMDTVINALASVKGLHVTARTSALKYKGRPLDVRKIGKELNVENLLEASVQVTGGEIRVTAQLNDCRTGYHLWSKKFDRRMDSVSSLFEIHDEIARAIVETLRAEHLGEADERPKARPTDSLEAYNLYLLGRHLWNMRGKDNLLKAVDYYQRALDIDAEFASPYMGLAEVYLTLWDNLELPPAECVQKAKQFAQKTLALDPENAGAHVCLAVIRSSVDFDFAGSEAGFRRSLDLNPGDAFAHQAYAFYLSDVGRPGEAITEMKLARDLDPLAPRIRANVGHVLCRAAKYEEARQELEEALKIDPRHPTTYAYLSEVCRMTGRYEEGVAHIKKAIALLDYPGFSAQLAIMYAESGETDRARAMIEELIGRAKTEFVSTVYLAAAFGSVGDMDIAFRLLEEAFAYGDARLISLGADPMFSMFRSDPRFFAILKRIGISDQPWIGVKYEPKGK